MFDYIEGFNPDEVRKPTTERELRVAEAAKLAGIDAYNFFENDGGVSFNVRTPDEDGQGDWISMQAVSNQTVDVVSLVVLAEIIRTNPNGNLKAEG